MEAATAARFKSSMVIIDDQKLATQRHKQANESSSDGRKSQGVFTLSVDSRNFKKIFTLQFINNRKITFNKMG